MDARDLSPGDRVALLVPGSLAYAELVIALLRRGVFPVPMDARLTASEREALLADLDPTLVVTTQDQLETCSPRSPDDPRRATAGPADPPDQRHHRSTQGRLLRAARARRGRGPARRGARPVGVRGRTTSTWCSARSTTRRRCGSRWAPCSPAAGSWCPARSTRRPSRRRSSASGRPRCSACRPTCNGSSPTGTSTAPPTCLVPARRARRRAVPEWVKRRLIEEFPAGSTWEFYGSTEGQFTACRSEEWLERPGHPGPGPARAHDDRRRRRPPVVRRTSACAVQLLRRPGEDRRRLAGDRRRTGLHGRRPRPDRRRRLRLPRRPPRGPDHQRRGQRLPGRGRAGARRAGRRRRHRGLRRRRRAVGPARLRRRRRRRSTRPTLRRARPRAPRAGQAAQGVPPPRRAPAHARPARYAGSTCPTWSGRER